MHTNIFSRTPLLSIFGTNIAHKSDRGLIAVKVSIMPTGRNVITNYLCKVKLLLGKRILLVAFLQLIPN